jgi:hypothetical protein
MANRRLRNTRGWPRLLAAELILAEAADHSDKLSCLGARQLVDHALAHPLPLLQEDQEIGHLLPVRPLVELPDDVGTDLAGGGQDPKEIPPRRRSERVSEANRILPKHRGASVSAAWPPGELPDQLLDHLEVESDGRAVSLCGAPVFVNVNGRAGVAHAR